MYRLPARVWLALGIPLLSGGCRIERTPDEYFDHARAVEVERAAAGGEVRDRLLAFVAAAGRGDPVQAVLSLNPAERVEVVGPGGVEVSGGEGMRALVTQLAATPVAVRVREVDVEAAPVGATAWFRLVMEAPGTTPEPSLYQATGVYVRDAGLWQLVQAHVSGPFIGAPSSLPDSVATPAGGE